MTLSGHVTLRGRSPESLRGARPQNRKAFEPEGLDRQVPVYRPEE